MKNNAHLLILLSCISLLFLSGCWDRRLFKDQKLIMAISLDSRRDGKIVNTVTFPNVDNGSPNKDVIKKTVANTPRQARLNIDTKIAKRFDASKLRVLLFGKRLASNGIFPALDVFYRDPRSSLMARLAVVNGKASTALHTKEPGVMESEYLGDLLESGISDTLISNNSTIQGIRAMMLQPGIDITVPLLQVYQDKHDSEIKGLALFNRDHYTGKFLSRQQSTLFLLMKGEKAQKARLTAKIANGRHPKIKNYMAIDIKDASPKQKVIVSSNGKISADLKLNLRVQLIEYPSDKLTTIKELKQVQRIASEKLTKKAQKIVTKVQKSGSDAFGIGLRVRAYHYNVWKKLHWKQTYRNIPISAKVNVTILQHGIIN